MKDGATACLSVLVPAESADDCAQELFDVGARAVEQRDHSTMSQIEDGMAELLAGFDNAGARDHAMRSICGAGDTTRGVRAIDVENGDWCTRWREFIKPVLLSRLQVVAPWMEIEDGDRIPIVIEPGQAFGTGGHATTRLILKLLERRAAVGTFPGRVLDLGSGSGVLGLAAVKLGAREVVAVDIDEESVLATRENATANQVAHAITVVHGSASDLHGRWPLVMANLQLSVFEECAADIARLVESGGEAILSGLLAEQVEPCLALWPGFEPVETAGEDGWAAVVVKPSP